MPGRASRELPPPTLIQGSWKDAQLHVLSRLLKDSEKLRPYLTWLLQGGGAEMSLRAGLQAVVLARAVCARAAFSGGMATCPGFGWDRVNFLLSSWYSAVFWI